MKLITLECPNCHASLEVDGDMSVAYCQYCGTKLLLADESIKINATINHNIRDETKIQELKTKQEVKLAKLKYKAERDRLTRKIIIGWIIFALVGAIGMVAYESISEHMYKHKIEVMAEEGRFTIGDHTELEGKKHKGIVKLLKGAGFTDIEEVHLDDKSFLSLGNGKVESVSINGNTVFSKNDFWDGSEHVVVTYH